VDSCGGGGVAGDRHRPADRSGYSRDPAGEWVVLYHQRWEIEIANDAWKSHPLDRRVHLRRRTPCGVVQELYGILLAYDAVRFLRHEAALAGHIAPPRLRFIHAVRVIRETASLMRAASRQPLPRLYGARIRPIAQGRLPPRDGRINPRVVQKKCPRGRKNDLPPAVSNIRNNRSNRQL